MPIELSSQRRQATFKKAASSFTSMYINVPQHEAEDALLDFRGQRVIDP